MEPKITVVAKDGKADVEIRSGSAFHVLKDTTQGVVLTDDINSFVEYYHYFEKYRIEQHIFQTFASESQVCLYHIKGWVNYDTMPILQCNLSTHPKLRYLSNHVGKTIPVDEFDLFLNNFKSSGNKEVVSLLYTVQNLRLEAVEEVVRQRDPRTGSYLYTVSKKVNENKNSTQIAFPESITIHCPVYNGLNNILVPFNFDLSFNYKVSDGKSVIWWTLTNFNFDSIVSDYYKNILTDYLKDHGISSGWGTLKINKQTDGWRYLSNPSK